MEISVPSSQRLLYRLEGLHELLRRHAETKEGKGRGGLWKPPEPITHSFDNDIVKLAYEPDIPPYPGTLHLTTSQVEAIEELFPGRRIHSLYTFLGDLEKQIRGLANECADAAITPFFELREDRTEYGWETSVVFIDPMFAETPEVIPVCQVPMTYRLIEQHLRDTGQTERYLKEWNCNTLPAFIRKNYLRDDGIPIHPLITTESGFDLSGLLWVNVKILGHLLLRHIVDLLMSWRRIGIKQGTCFDEFRPLHLRPLSMLTAAVAKVVSFIDTFGPGDTVATEFQAETILMTPVATSLSPSKSQCGRGRRRKYDAKRDDRVWKLWKESRHKSFVKFVENFHDQIPEEYSNVNAMRRLQGRMNKKTSY